MTTTDPITAAEQAIVAEHQIHEKIVNEEFKIWKKTVPLLYDTIHTLALQYPLLAVDFFPAYSVSDDKNDIAVSLAVGTNSSGNDQDYIHVIEASLPSTLAPNFADFAAGESLPIPTSAPGNALKIILLWKHPSEGNTVRVLPDGTKVASFDKKGTIHVHTIGQDASQSFLYHTLEGYCLEWVSDLLFLSGANDSKIGLWDIASRSSPTKKFNTHTAVINSLSYNKASKVLFGSVADDFSTQIHDLRAPEQSPAIKITEKFVQNAILFHPSIVSLFATAGKDNVVSLYDARNIKEPLRKFYGHNDSVVGLRWGGVSEPSLLYSWGLDKCVLSYDLKLLSEEFTPPTADVGDSKRLKQSADPCLQFVHGGHIRRINDLALHPTIPNLFASVGDDCLLEVYKPKIVLGHSEDAEDSDAKEESEKEKTEMEGEDDNDEQVEKPDANDMDVDQDNDEDTAREEDDENNDDIGKKAVKEEGDVADQDEKEDTPAE